MGKVHRIKRRFKKIVAHIPWDTLPSRGSSIAYPLGERVTLHCGIRYDGSRYVRYYGESYKALLRKLIQDYTAG